MIERTVTEHKGIKYSLGPHGVKSKLIVAFSLFVVAFGGALAVMSPAQAAPGDVVCFVETTPGPSSSPIPAPTMSQIPCPTPSPVVRVTMRTVTVIKTVVVTPSTSEPPSPSASFDPLPPLETPGPLQHGALEDVGLVVWGVGAALILGAIAGVVGLVGVIRNRRRGYGAHHLDSERDDEDEDEESLTGRAYYDQNLAGHFAQDDATVRMPRVSGDTEVMPPVE